MENPSITVFENCGTPCVIFSHDAIWSLVEYLAYQRVQAHFSFDQDAFTVLFPHLSMEATQQILRDWQSYDRAAEHAPSTHAPSI